MTLEKPNWNDYHDRLLYNQLSCYILDRKLTEQEEKFCKTMYHFEEFDCGLDGN